MEENAGEGGVVAPDVPPVVPEADFAGEILGDTPPEFIVALEAELKEGESFKGPRPNWSEYPPEVQRQVVNLRRMAHAKTNEAARAKAEAEAQAATFTSQRQALEAERNQLLQLFHAPSLKELLAPVSDAPPDAYADPAGFAAHHGKLAAQEAMKGLLERLGRVSDEAKAQAEAAIAEQHFASRKSEVEAFIASKGDFAQYANEVANLVEKHGFTAEMGYEYAKALATHRAAAQPEPAQEQQAPFDPRAAMRAPGRPTGVQLPPTPKELDAYQLDAWYERNPGTRQRDAAEYTRRYEMGLA